MGAQEEIVDRSAVAAWQDLGINNHNNTNSDRGKVAGRQQQLWVDKKLRLIVWLSTT